MLAACRFSACKTTRLFPSAPLKSTQSRASGTFVKCSMLTWNACHNQEMKPSLADPLPLSPHFPHRQTSLSQPFVGSLLAFR